MIARILPLETIAGSALRRAPLDGTSTLHTEKSSARRTLHLRFNDLEDPQPIPRDTDYASVFESDVSIIVQHTRLDSRRAEVALMSTVAYSEG